VTEFKAVPKVRGQVTADLPGFQKLVMTTDQAPTLIAQTYVLAGDHDKAFAYLQKAFDEQDTELTACLWFPVFAPLHGDPRWSALVRKLGLPD
jgi:hypothetical protein